MTVRLVGSRGKQGREEVREEGRNEGGVGGIEGLWALSSNR